MNSTLSQSTAAPQPLLSTAARIAAGVAALALLSAAWMTAEQASHQAVATTSAALSRTVTYVTLPPVYIVAHREPAQVASAAASGAENPAAGRSTGL